MKTIAALAFVLFAAVFVAAQDRRSIPEYAAVRASAAYSEVLLRRTEILAELDAVSASYTENHPKVLDLKSELAALERDTDKLFAVRASDAGKLTLGLGKLIVRKAVLEAELARLNRSYSKEHPDVQRAKKRVEIFENAIAEVLK